MENEKLSATDVVLRDLYPECEIFTKDFLPEMDGHRIYFEQTGNRSGIPVVFLHGGPGSGCNEGHRRYFDPDAYHVILFDQRGCHRSSAQNLFVNNTTHALLADMERMRSLLGIQKWVLYGGSWGATLALLYAEQYPQRVSGIILRGTFLAREKDLRWFFGEGVNYIFPDHWQKFCSHFTAAEQKNKIDTLYAWLTHGDVAQKRQAACIWAQWAGTVVTASQQGDYHVDTSAMEELINSVSIELHYAINRYFITEDQILENVHHLPQVPTYLLHGRRDLTCLPAASWDLHRAIPHSNLTFISAAGHLAGEPAMIDGLIHATDEMRNTLG